MTDEKRTETHLPPAGSDGRSTLPSAREVTPVESGPNQGRGSDEATKRPTPARAMGKSEGQRRSVEPEVTEVRFEVDGRSWIATVTGRSGGTASGATPLLQVGFAPADPPEPEVYQALVVGKTLEGVSTAALAAALESVAGAHPPPDGGRRGGNASPADA